MSETKKWTLLSKVKDFFLKEDGGKKIVHLPKVIITFGVIPIVIFTLISLYLSVTVKIDTSRINKSSGKIAKDNMQSNSTNQNNSQMGGIKDQGEINSSGNVPRKTVNRVQINYRAKQVLSANHVNGGKVLPIGVNLIGKLLTSIDTRAVEQIVKVLLPYGGKHKGSGGSLPSNTILFGKVSYSGRGEKVLLNFDRGLLPNGEEIRLQAQALSSKDYSVGLTGELHGNVGGRTAAVLGLTMVGSMSETLVQKEALGQGFSITPKASMQNGFYNGVSKVANMEANRTAQEMAAEKDYVTVDAGHDLIVSLTGSYEAKE